MRRTASSLTFLLVAGLASSVPLASAAGPAQPGGADGARSAASDPIIRGKAVNAHSGKPLRNVVVRLHDVVSREVIARATTDARGRFRLDGAGEEEWGVFVNGSARGFERGWLACDGDTLVRSWGAACSHGTRIGAVYLHRD